MAGGLCTGKLLIGKTIVPPAERTPLQVRYSVAVSRVHAAPCVQSMRAVSLCAGAGGRVSCCCVVSGGKPPVYSSSLEIARVGSEPAVEAARPQRRGVRPHSRPSAMSSRVVCLLINKIHCAICVRGIVCTSWLAMGVCVDTKKTQRDRREKGSERSRQRSAGALPSCLRLRGAGIHDVFLRNTVRRHGMIIRQNAERQRKGDSGASHHDERTDFAFAAGAFRGSLSANERTSVW